MVGYPINPVPTDNTVDSIYESSNNVLKNRFFRRKIKKLFGNRKFRKLKNQINYLNSYAMICFIGTTKSNVPNNTQSILTQLLSTLSVCFEWIKTFLSAGGITVWRWAACFMQSVYNTLRNTPIGQVFIGCALCSTLVLFISIGLYGKKVGNLGDMIDKIGKAIIRFINWCIKYKVYLIGLALLLALLNILAFGKYIHLDVYLAALIKELNRLMHYLAKSIPSSASTEPLNLEKNPKEIKPWQFLACFALLVVFQMNLYEFGKRELIRRKFDTDN